MTRKGNCFDNAVIESFFGALKAGYFSGSLGHGDVIARTATNLTAICIWQ